MSRAIRGLIRCSLELYQFEWRLPVAPAEVDDSRYLGAVRISSRVSVVGESAADFERCLLVAEAQVGDSGFTVVCISSKISGVV